MTKDLWSEINKHFQNLEKLYDIAWDLNDCKYSKTEFSALVVEYLPGVLMLLNNIINGDQYTITQTKCPHCSAKFEKDDWAYFAETGLCQYCHKQI